MITLTLEDYQEFENDNVGICLACGEEQWGCEPDAREYVCEGCGEARVYGVPELLIMGEIEII